MYVHMCAGLSYSSFAYSLASAPASSIGKPISLDAVRSLLAETVRSGRIFPASDAVTAAAPLVQYAVNVTNSGSIDADDVVLGFLKPPGAGTGGVPLQTLFGFKRIHLQAGETKTVYLYPALTDFTQVDEQGARYVLPGRYTFAFGVAETAPHGMGYAEHVVQTV